MNIKTPCPTCGSTTLFVDDSGNLVCSLIGCANPVVGKAIKDLAVERGDFKKRWAEADELARKIAIQGGAISAARDKLIRDIEEVRAQLEKVRERRDRWKRRCEAVEALLKDEQGAHRRAMTAIGRGGKTRIDRESHAQDAVGYHAAVAPKRPWPQNVNIGKTVQIHRAGRFKNRRGVVVSAVPLGFDVKIPGFGCGCFNDDELSFVRNSIEPEKLNVGDYVKVLRKGVAHNCIGVVTAIHGHIHEVSTDDDGFTTHGWYRRSDLEFLESWPKPNDAAVTATGGTAAPTPKTLEQRVDDLARKVERIWTTCFGARSQ